MSTITHDAHLAAAAEAAGPAKPPSWFAHLPVPKSIPGLITPEELHLMLSNERDGQQLEEGIDWVVVDVRRADIETPLDFLIPSAINLPAHTFHQTLPALYPLLSNVPLVIFHCSSSNGRGPRCAAWYQDALDAKGETKSKALVLVGGIKAWAEKYPEDKIRL